MALYQASYSAMEPVWGDVRFNADDPEEAEIIAKEEIVKLYPEYIDVSIDSVETVND